MDIEKLIKQLRYLADTPSYTAFHDAKEREIICDQCEADFCYDKQQDAHWCMYEALSRAATALSTLQAENEKLRSEVERQRRSADNRKHLYENAERAYMKVVAELEKVKRERDAAQSLLAEQIGVRGAEPITTAFGISLDRLHELAQADREGRCVVLPCDPGQVVWAANSFGVSSHKIRMLVRGKDGDFACSMIKFPLEDFGRKVFLTRAEAEAALKARDQE